jgi:hypothetical protein
MKGMRHRKRHARTAFEVVDTVHREIWAGRLSRTQGELLIGFVFLESARLVPDHPQATYYRRCRDLERIGLLKEGKLLKGGRRSSPVDVDFGS